MRSVLVLAALLLPQQPRSDVESVAPTSLDAAAMEADLRQLAEALRNQWSYFEMRTAQGLDLDALLETSVEATRSARSPANFARILRRFVAALHDGHAKLSIDVAYEPDRNLPFTLADSADGIVVSRVADGLKRPGVGDRLTELDGVPTEAALEAAAAEVFASTPSGRRLGALRRLARTHATRVTCCFRSPSGATYAVELPASILRAPSLSEPLEDPSPRVSWPEAGVALLRVPTFAVPQWREWLEAKPEERETFLTECKASITSAIQEVVSGDARALILDVRGNGGGTDSLGIHLAEHLLEEPFRYFQLSALRDGAWSKPFGYVYGQDPPPARYLGPLCVLIDGGCFSTTDNFLRCLEDVHPDVTFVGQPTGGGTGAPRVLVQLERSGAKVTACTQRVYGPNGMLTEGWGTAPDIAALATAEEIVAGTDVALRAALAHLRTRGEPRSDR